MTTAVLPMASIRVTFAWPLALALGRVVAHEGLVVSACKAAVSTRRRYIFQTLL